MKVIELKDFEIHKMGYHYTVCLFVTLHDEGDAYDNYKITKKNYNEILTIQETRNCDAYLVKLYDEAYFEEDYVAEYNEPEDEELGWFV
jgi:hypothetical protein